MWNCPLTCPRSCLLQRPTPPRPYRGPLLDRMELIEVNSHTENEKFHIARDYLVTKQMERNGLKEDRLHFPIRALRK